MIGSLARRKAREMVLVNENIQSLKDAVADNIKDAAILTHSIKKKVVQIARTISFEDDVKET